MIATETATPIASEPSAECRIYVACLASYNNGRLYGRWIDVDGKDADELREEVNEILRGSPYPNVLVCCPVCEDVEPEACETCKGKGKVPSAEEFAIHDHEGFGRMIGEYTPLDDVAAIAEALAGDYADGFRYLVENIGMSPSDAADKAEDVQTFEGTAEDYAAEFVEEHYSEALEALPSFVRHAIDWERVARDLRLGGDIAEAEIDGRDVIITNASEF